MSDLSSIDTPGAADGCARRIDAEAAAEQRQRVELLTDAFSALQKALRGLGIYSSDHKVAREFVSEAGGRFAAVPEALGDTWIDVGAKVLGTGESAVFEEEPESEGFVFRLHRDGVRRLCLLHGLEPEEIERLTQVLRADLNAPEYFDADMVTLLWDAELEGLRYIVAELLAERDDDGEDLGIYRDLMDEIISAATKALLPEGVEARHDETLLRIASQAMSDVDPERVVAALEAAEMTGERRLRVAAGTDGAWIKRLHAQLEDPDLLTKFTEILYRGVAASVHVEDPDALSTFDLLIQALVQKHRHTDLFNTLALVRALGQPRPTSGAQSGPGLSRAAERMLACLEQQSRLELLVSSLERPDQVDLEALVAVLRMTSAEMLPTLLRCGVALSAPAQRMLVDVLAELAAAEPQRLGGHLSAKDRGEVQLACTVLLQLDTDAALETLEPLRRHPDPELRMELLRATRRSRSKVVRRVRLALVSDQHPRVRAEAEQRLLAHNDPDLSRQLLRRIALGELKGCSFEEKQRICVHIGAAGGEREVRTLRALVGERHLVGRRDHKDLCAAAAFGLAATGDLAHVELLEREAGRRLTDRQVRNACRDSVALLRAGERPPGLSRPVLPVVSAPQQGAPDRQERARLAARRVLEQRGQRRRPADETDDAPSTQPEAVGGVEGYGFVDLGDQADEAEAPPVEALPVEPSSLEPHQVEPSPVEPSPPEPSIAEPGPNESVDDLLRAYVIATEPAPQPPPARSESEAKAKSREVDDLLRGFLDGGADEESI